MTLNSVTFIPVIFLRVLLARSKANLTASSKLFGDPAITVVTRATLPSGITVPSLAGLPHRIRLEDRNGCCQLFLPAKLDTASPGRLCEHKARIILDRKSV